MSEVFPAQFNHVSVVCQANLYFGGNVASHTVLFDDGTRKTLGLIYPGQYTFDTAGPERMQIIAGVCRVRLVGEKEEKIYGKDTMFHVPAHSSFDIRVEEDVCQYICSYE